MKNHRRLIILLLATPLVIYVAWVGYLKYGSLWSGTTKEPIEVFSAEEGPAYGKDANGKPLVPISSLAKGETVSVVWDTYGKDYWACYIRTNTGLSGWVLCTSLTNKFD